MNFIFKVGRLLEKFRTKLLKFPVITCINSVYTCKEIILNLIKLDL